MGNSHSHRKFHNTPPPSIYPPSVHPSQIPASTNSRINMVSLPYTHVDSCLRALAGQAEGFGRLALGGLHGPLYCVTTLADDGPGSLREGCRKKEPLWIVFEVSGTIHLSSYLSVSSYKTIDGRGQKIEIKGKGLRLKECEHVIVCNLHFEGGRGPDVDAIQIKPNSKHIWIDRCTLRDYDDGLIDITRESTDITVSRCHFSQHDKTILIGADASHFGDRCIRVTIHHCFFDGTRQRHPRVRFGKVHLYNNYTRNWGIYAVCASVESQIYSQCNIYEAGHKKVAFKYLTEKELAIYAQWDGRRKECLSNFKKDNSIEEPGLIRHTGRAADRGKESSGCITSEGDFFTTGTKAGLLTIGEHSMFHPSEYYPAWTVQAPTDDLKQALQHCTGWQCVPRPADQTATV